MFPDNSLDSCASFFPKTLLRKCSSAYRALSFFQKLLLRNCSSKNIAGLERGDVKVTVEGNRTLEISGERTREEENKTDTWHRVERSYGKFSRRFHLPDDANVEAVNAKVENGLLTVTVPKIKKTELEVRVVDIN